MNELGVQAPVGFWDPLNVAGASGSLYGFNNEQTIAWYRQAEIKHGRVAMAAFVGYCVQANGGHWATKMTLGGANWPSGEHLRETQISGAQRHRRDVVSVAALTG